MPPIKKSHPKNFLAAIVVTGEHYGEDAEDDQKNAKQSEESAVLGKDRIHSCDRGHGWI